MGTTGEGFAVPTELASSVPRTEPVGVWETGFEMNLNLNSIVTGIKNAVLE
jgi:hypothetical protein